ncbi:MAG: hypothetical protein COA88_12560 [Kordia sp.]|nr:MAG: hypothetical protein COA88_12560 [Kordia sp.]
MTKTNRETQSIQEIIWNIDSKNHPKKIHQFMFYEFNVVKKGKFLSKSKYKKYSFIIDKIINNE